MEKHARGWFCQLAGPDTDRDCPVHDFRVDWDGLLDGWLAVRQPAVRGGAHDVRIALLQPVFLSHDGKDLPGAHDHMPDLYHDPDFKHGYLFAAIG